LNYTRFGVLFYGKSCGSTTSLRWKNSSKKQTRHYCNGVSLIYLLHLVIKPTALIALFTAATGYFKSFVAFNTPQAAA